jgi:hypothetical protein
MILLTHQRPSQGDAALPRERKEGERKPKLRVGFESHEARAIRRTSSTTDAA